MAHHCHARGCTTPCPPEFLMCLAHWRLVPQAIQRAVYTHYRAGQCDDRMPSEAWFVAADAAISAVYHLENPGLLHQIQKKFPLLSWVIARKVGATREADKYVGRPLQVVRYSTSAAKVPDGNGGFTRIGVRVLSGFWLGLGLDSGEGDPLDSSVCRADAEDCIPCEPPKETK